MTYYKINKEQLLKFYKQNITNSGLLPSYHTFKKNIDGIYDTITRFSSYSDLEFDDMGITRPLKINEFTGDDENFKNIISFSLDFINRNPSKYVSSELLKLFKNINFDTNEAFTLPMFNALHINDKMEVISLILSIPKIHSQKNIYFLSSSINKYKFFESFIAHYLPEEEKIKNFLNILNNIENINQTSIIEIDFGTETEIPYIPILNTESMNQAFSAYYMDLDSFIIQSQSNLDIIEKSIGKVSVPNNDEVYSVIQNSINLSQVSSSLFKSISNNIEIKPELKIDINQNLLELLDDKINPLSLNSFYQKFNQVIDKNINNNLNNTQNYTIDNCAEFLEIEYLKDPVEFENEYIKNIKKLLSEPSKNLEIIKFLSPSSPFMKENSINLTTERFKENLLKNINLVEALYLYFNNNSIAESNRKNNPQSKINDDLFINGKQLTLESQEYSFLDKNGKNILEELLIKIKNNDSAIYNILNKDKVYIHLQQDIYPLLQLKEKLNIQNYNCFYQAFITKKNCVLHIDSLPLALYQDDGLFENIIKSFFSDDIFLMQAHKTHFEFYLPEILKYKIMENFDEKYQNQYLLEHTTISKLLKKTVNLKNLYNNLVTNNEHIVFFEKIFQSERAFPTLTKNVTLNFISSQFLLIKEELELPLLFNLLPFINQQTSDKYLNLLFNHKDFNLLDKHHVNHILSLYNKDNNCFNYASSKKVKSFFRKPEIIELIIDFHKKNQTTSSNLYYDLRGEDFDSNYTIHTSKSLTKIIHNKLDLMYLSKNLIHYLPEDIKNDVNLWKEKTTEIINLFKNRTVDIMLPAKIKFNYEYFKFFLDITIKIEKNNDVTVNLEALKLLTQFSPLFIQKQENVIKFIENMSMVYETKKNINFNPPIVYSIEKINKPLYNNLSGLMKKCEKDNYNYMKDILIKFENDKLIKEIPVNPNLDKMTKVLKF